jgi:hypothetical protein
VRRANEQFEHEFFKQARFLLLCLYQIKWGENCTEIAGHVNNKNKKLHFELTMLGYTDTIWEMKLIVEEELQRLSAARWANCGLICYDE